MHKHNTYHHDSNNANDNSIKNLNSSLTTLRSPLIEEFITIARDPLWLHNARDPFGRVRQEIFVDKNFRSFLRFHEI